MSKPWLEGKAKGREGLIKVAALQMEPHVGDKEGNLKRSAELIEKAASQSAKLVVLSELCNTGYVFNNRTEVETAAEEVPGGVSCNLWQEKAEELGVYISAGIAERHRDSLYDSAVLIGPEGHLGTYRKLHLWDEEKLFFEPGDLGLPVFKLPFGRVGMMICYDGWMPEVTRILALQGVDLICDPTAWVEVPPLMTPDHPLAPEVHMAQAHMNNIYIICCARIGTEREVRFLGSSCIVGPSGFVSGPASPFKEEIVTGELNLMKARYKNWSQLANPISDRRIDVYDRMLGYRGIPQPLG